MTTYNKKQHFQLAPTFQEIEKLKETRNNDETYYNLYSSSFKPNIQDRDYMKQKSLK